MAKAGFSGFFMKGLAGGITSGVNIGTQLTQLKWQKKKQKELEDMTLKMNDSWNSIGQELISLAEDGQLSEDDKLKIYTLTIAAPYEMQGVMQNLRTSLAQFKTDDFDNQMELVKTFYDYAQGMDVTDIDSLYETFRGHITDPHALTLFEVCDKKLRHEYEAGKIEQKLDITEKLPGPYKYPYMKGEGMVPEITPTETTKEPTVAERKFDWATEAYQKGLRGEPGGISWEEYKKYMGVSVTPEKATGLEKSIKDIITQGNKMGISKEEINKAVKDKILGKEAGALTPTAPAVETVRDAIKNAPTIEDAKRIEKNHIAKYGDTLGIPSIDKFWSDERARRLNTIKQGIDKLLDEKKRLKKGTITSAEVGFEIEDDIQKVEAVYKQLREEYMKYRKMLEEMGVDVSQFPELMSYEEYIKTDIKPGMGIFYPSTWGKQKPPVY